MKNIIKIAIDIIVIGGLVLFSKYVPDGNLIWYYTTCAIIFVLVSKLFKRIDKMEDITFNRYEIWFEEKIGDTNSFYKAMDIATEILDTIKKHPKEDDKDEYVYLQIRCYHWIDRLFKIKHKSVPVIRYTLVVWSEVKNMFVVNRY